MSCLRAEIVHFTSRRTWWQTAYSWNVVNILSVTSDNVIVLHNIMLAASATAGIYADPPCAHINPVALDHDVIGYAGSVICATAAEANSTARAFRNRIAGNMQFGTIMSGGNSPAGNPVDNVVG